MLYLELFRAFDRHQVRYLLVGGLAMNLHGVPHQDQSDIEYLERLHGR